MKKRIIVMFVQAEALLGKYEVFVRQDTGGLSDVLGTVVKTDQALGNSYTK